MTVNIKTYALTKDEKDTYELKSRKKKELLSEDKILEHWNLRARRRDVQTVMSARHSLKENMAATKLLQKDIMKFLKPYVENKDIFELGFGIGRMTIILSKNANKIVGCDVSPIMLKKAKKNLKGVKNVELHLGKINHLNLAQKHFDLVFDSIVLLHILNKAELRKTAEAMKKLSNIIFICEHIYEGPNFPISKFTILRKPEEYEELFKPYKLVKQKIHLCAGDKFILMLFKK